MATNLFALYRCQSGVLHWFSVPGPRRIEWYLLLGEPLRYSSCRDVGMDGGLGVVGPEMGSAGPRIQFEPAMEAGRSASCHAGAPIVTGIGLVGSLVGQIGGPVAGFPHLQRVGCNVVIGSVRLPASVFSGPSPDGPTPGIAPRIREPEAFAKPAGTEREAGVAGKPGGGSGT